MQDWGFTLMLTFHADILFFIPIGLCIAFMFWVLYGFWNDERRR
jgi:hypothetical protein